MATTYAIYSNGGSGGPVDESTPLLTTSSTSAVLPAYPSGVARDTTYLVRVTDTATGIEEENTDCVVRVAVDASGADVTAKPAAPAGLSARATASGGCRVGWLALPVPARSRVARPASFKVWLTAGGTPDESGSPAAVVPSGGPGLHSVDLAGLADGVTYVVSVRATNASGDGPGASFAGVVGAATGPAAVGGLSASATFAGP